jgi:hypothetical protein
MMWLICNFNILLGCRCLNKSGRWERVKVWLIFMVSMAFGLKEFRHFGVDEDFLI